MLRTPFFHRLVAILLVALAGMTLLLPVVLAAPNLMLSRTSGSPGDTVSASGSGFLLNEQVRLCWNTFIGCTGTPLATVTANADGSFSNLTFQIPSDAVPGLHVVIAVGDDSGSTASVDFTVVSATLTPTPSMTPTQTPTATPTTPGVTSTSTATATSTTSASATATATPTDGVPDEQRFRSYLPRVARKAGAPSTILIANAGPIGDVAEVNRRGQIVWQLTGLNQPRTAERLTSGNTLIAEAGANRVIEVNRFGHIVWSVTVEGPSDARRLANGNTLITSSANGGEILELAADVSIAWSYAFQQYCVGLPVRCQGAPVNAIRLAHGNTLISVNDSAVGLIEVDAAGTVVKQHGGLIAYGMQLLTNGNVLITGSGTTAARIVELTPSWSEVWSYGPEGFCDECLYLPRDAFRTAAGTTLIADYGKNRVLEVDPGGQILWRYERAESGPWSVREVPPELSTPGDWP